MFDRKRRARALWLVGDALFVAWLVLVGFVFAALVYALLVGALDFYLNENR